MLAVRVAPEETVIEVHRLLPAFPEEGAGGAEVILGDGEGGGGGDLEARQQVDRDQDDGGGEDRE